MLSTRQNQQHGRTVQLRYKCALRTDSLSKSQAGIWHRLQPPREYPAVAWRYGRPADKTGPRSCLRRQLPPMHWRRWWLPCVKNRAGGAPGTGAPVVPPCLAASLGFCGCTQAAYLPAAATHQSGSVSLLHMQNESRCLRNQRRGLRTAMQQPKRTLDKARIFRTHIAVHAELLQVSTHMRFTAAAMVPMGIKACLMKHFRRKSLHSSDTQSGIAGPRLALFVIANMTAICGEQRSFLTLTLKPVMTSSERSWNLHL